MFDNFYDVNHYESCVHRKEDVLNHLNASSLL